MSTSWRQYIPLQKKKKRQEEGKCIIEGVRLCHEGLLSDWETEIAFVSEAFTQSSHWGQFQELFKLKKIAWQLLPPQHFNRLADTETPQGVLMITKIPSYRPDQLNFSNANFVLLLQGIRDPGNLGTIIRTADWYGAGAAILSRDCVDSFNPKVLRGTMGSIFHLPVYTTPDLTEEIRQLKEKRFQVVTSSLSSDAALHKTRFKPPVALILGGEARGVSADIQKLADINVRIRRYGNADSLNVAIAGGIFMDHIVAQILKNKG